MSYRNDRLNKRMKSVEEMTTGMDMSKWRVLSDWGIGVERMVDEIDDRSARDSRARPCRHVLVGHEHYGEDDDRDDRLWEAEMRLADAGKSYLIRVLLLIVENGADRESSLRSIPRRTYFRHRGELLDFFTGGARSSATAAG